MWKDSVRNIVVIFQTNILRIVGFYVRHSAPVNIFSSLNGDLEATLISGTVLAVNISEF